MYHTYILHSTSTDQYYTGYTSHKVEERLEQHNEGQSPSTKAGAPWQIKYIKSFEGKTEAIKWENVIKRQKSRRFIEKLIASHENEYPV